MDALPFHPGQLVLAVGDSLTGDLQSWAEILRYLLDLRRPGGVTWVGPAPARYQVSLSESVANLREFKPLDELGLLWWPAVAVPIAVGVPPGSAGRFHPRCTFG